MFLMTMDVMTFSCLFSSKIAGFLALKISFFCRLVRAGGFGMLQSWSFLVLITIQLPSPLFCLNCLIVVKYLNASVENNLLLNLQFGFHKGLGVYNSFLTITNLFRKHLTL